MGSQKESYRISQVTLRYQTLILIITILFQAVSVLLLAFCMYRAVIIMKPSICYF